MLLEDVILDLPGDDRVLDPTTWFPTPGPLEVEIGCGKGGFLLSRARADGRIRLLGIEWANKYFRYCADRMARWQVANVRVIRADAREFLMHHLPPGCISMLHLYHPDPWPKRRHHKRRLIQPDFVEAAVNLLEPGGRWLIQSDHADYFQWINDSLGRHPKLRCLDWEQVQCEVSPDWGGTNFEVKYSREGRAIHRAGYVKS